MVIPEGAETGFYLMESCVLGGRQALLDMGHDAHILFHGDGTVEWLEMHLSMAGTWADGVIEADVGGTLIRRRYAVEGDLLTVFDEGGDASADSVYRRCDREAFLREAPASVRGGETASLPVTDGFIRGSLSAVCPDGWGGGVNAAAATVSFAGLGAEGHRRIDVMYGIKERVALEGERLDDMAEPDGGRVWEAAFDEGEGSLAAVTYSGGNAVKVTASGLSFDEEADGMLFGDVLASASLTWEAEEGGFGICEGGGDDFFELRSMSVSGAVADRELLMRLGYDWCMLFRPDGTVTAKLDGAVTRHWGDGIGAVVHGAWDGRLIAFMGGDPVGTVGYALEGDRLSLVLPDVGGRETPVAFQRSGQAPPEFGAFG